MAASVGPVVAGTDFSETAGLALLEARRLAGLLGARLEVVHVTDGAPGGPWPASETAAEWLAAAGLKPDEVVVRQGTAWVELARYAGEVGPSLVVVGSHGTTGYQPLNIGSTAARVCLHARCSVVVVSPRMVMPAEGMQDRKWNVANRAEAVAVAREPGDS